MNRPRPPSDNGIGDPTSGGVARFPRWADQETKLAFAIWLGREDSNLRMAESKSDNLCRQVPQRVPCRHRDPSSYLFLARQNPTYADMITILGADMVPT
jgi:hypothetical protein